MYKFYIISKEVEKESIYQQESYIIYTLKNRNGITIKLKMKNYNFDTDEERMKKIKRLMKDFINTDDMEIINILD